MMGFKQKTIKRRLMGFIMVISLLVCYAFPTMAQEATFHSWATMTLLQGEKYGIYPLDWYENMQAELDAKTLQQFCTAIGKKLEAISGVTLKADAKALTYEQSDAITRGKVLESIYEVLHQYTYPIAIDLENDAITYMQDKQIIMGTGKDLQLNKVCTLEEAAVFGTRIVKAFYEDLNAGAKGLLWKTQKGDNTVYMLGSIHVANYDIYPFSENILDAFEAADVLGVELNFYNQEGIAAFNQIATYTDGTKLKDHVSKELYAKVLEAAQKLGMTEADIEYYKPWYIANSFTSTVSAAASSPEETQLAALLGIDNYFMSDALMTGMPVYELEGYAYQAELLDGFSPALQEYYLSSATEMMLDDEVGSESAESVTNWLQYWKEGNLEEFEKSFSKDTSSNIDLNEENKAIMDEYYNKLFTTRDLEMTDKIEALLNDEEGKTYFIVVGSGHYVDETGVIQNLKNKGYEVQQIK